MQCLTAHTEEHLVFNDEEDVFMEGLRGMNQISVLWSCIPLTGKHTKYFIMRGWDPQMGVNITTCRP